MKGNSKNFIPLKFSSCYDQKKSIRDDDINQKLPNELRPLVKDNYYIEDKFEIEIEEDY